MNATFRKVRAREYWIKCCKELGSVSKAARKCGIPRSTMYRWLLRYEQSGKDGLHDKSRRPDNLAKLKITPYLERLILSVRAKHKWGPQRIGTYLKREKNIQLSGPTIWRVLKKHEVKPLKRYRSKKSKRYSELIPGARIQVDVTKIRRGCYQFSAVDDCTRLKVLRIYERKTAENSVLFLYEMIEGFGFPIQRIQTDWGSEFFNDRFQEELIEHFIKYRPIRPRSPHLNGKVERGQQTDKAEFYSLLNLKDKSLPLKELLSKWERYYNHERPHSSLGGKTPWEKYLEMEKKIPIQPEVSLEWYKGKEKIKVRDSEYQRWLKKHPQLSHLS